MTLNTALSVIVVTLVFEARLLYGGVQPNAVAAGIRVDDPAPVLSVFSRKPRLENEDLFFVSWNVALDGTADPTPISAVRATGATPWLRAIFRTPQPIAENLDHLETELEELASLVRGAGEELFVQAVWLPDGRAAEIRDHAFLYRR